MIDNKLYKEIKDGINEIKIFDTHEHLMYESERRTKKLDFFTIYSAYVLNDLITAGLKIKDAEKLDNPDISLGAKWDIFSQYWDYVKNTTFSKVITVALRDLYNIDEINMHNVEKITEIINKSNKEDYYKFILKEKSNIEFILNDIDTLGEYGITIIEPDENYFLPVMRPDNILALDSAEKFAKIEEDNNRYIYSFSDFLKMIDEIFDKRKDKIHALKVGAAYSRELFIEDVPYSEAEKSFLKILKLDNFEISKTSIALQEIKPFQDFMWHYFIKKSIENNLPIQIHTGLLVRNANDTRNSNPTHLTRLLLKYRNAKFDIFHIGYPYTDELIGMVKMFPNSFINLCWISALSENLYKRTLDSLIDMIPSNKIFAFGGDYIHVEGTYGALEIAKEAISEVLYKRVLNKFFSIEEAIEFARRILNENPKQIYNKFPN